MNKVVCIDESGYYNINLTEGKVYDKIKCYSDWYIRVINDIGVEYVYRCESFMCLEDYRDKKIDEILRQDCGGV